ncbi:alpha/beta hydrolase family protein [Kineosporia succinea]|uniref:Dienelactone hydrolase n=1 Tax=Kineosporia succinea TaxID=84632 RepID=A0ABT9P6V6_9ACTN|nr:chlorophyllase [Kineosporia succinea]MDP9828432.1 putative dienelactone hydrolase [Kineosporia succinea]
MSTISLTPVVLPSDPDRGEPLQVRVTAPADGSGLPVIVLSHGYSESMRGYGPLVDHWAAAGFVVIQPTHLDSATLGLAPDDPRQPHVWRHRVNDVTGTIDHLGVVEAAVPGLAGRIDHDRIAVAGHSWGGTTVSFPLGARVVDGEVMTDPRVRAGILLATPGLGGENLTAFAAQAFPFMNLTFEDLDTPTLVVAGDHDQSFLSEVRGPEWFTEPYTLSPGAQALLTLFGAEHSLGGISGYQVAATTDENPAVVALVREISTAWLRSALKLDPQAFPAAVAALAASASPAGTVETRA